MLPLILTLALLAGGPLSNLPSIVSPEDRDLLVRTVIGEANSQPAVGQRAVAHVVLNRLNRGGYGSTVPEVLFKPAQFEPWNTRRSELLSYAENDPAYQRAARQVDAVLGGAEDPTGGATHFANVGTVRDRGNTRAMGWINNMADPVKIGAHTFGKADEGRGGRLRTIDTSDDEDPPVGVTRRGGGGRGRGSGGGAGDSFNLSSLLAAINEKPKDDAHAEVKNLMADTLESVMGDLGAPMQMVQNDNRSQLAPLKRGKNTLTPDEEWMQNYTSGAARQWNGQGGRNMDFMPAPANDA